MLNNNVFQEVQNNLGAVELHSPYHLYKCTCELFGPKSSASQLCRYHKFFCLSCAAPNDVQKFCTVIEQMCKKLHTKTLFTDDIIARVFNLSDDDSYEVYEEKQRIVDKMLKFSRMLIRWLYSWEVSLILLTQ